jgi:hypothetical protein
MIVTRTHGRCFFCGAEDPQMRREHIVPVHLGGSKTSENIIKVCSRCSAHMWRPIKEIDFEAGLLQLMRASGDFDNVETRVEYSNNDGRCVQADISARDVRTGRRQIVECKAARSVSQQVLDEAAEELRLYRSAAPDANLVLAFLGRFRPEEKERLRKLDVELWDLDAIAQRFRTQIDQVDNPDLKRILQVIAALEGTSSITRERQFIRDLEATIPGREHWSRYQKLVTRIFEHMFCPPLSTPWSEHSDMVGVNRRDIVLPNYANDGFWSFVRNRYGADFIVADAKNHTDEVGKDEALQILNYLKEDGAGLLGIIVSRRGPDHGCQHTIREHWIRHRKLIVCLADRDIEQMLMLKEACAQPESVIRDAIASFRLSL